MKLNDGAREEIYYTNLIPTSKFAYVKLKPYSTKICLFRQARALHMQETSLYCREGEHE